MLCWRLRKSSRPRLSASPPPSFWIPSLLNWSIIDVVKHLCMCNFTGCLSAADFAADCDRKIYQTSLCFNVGFNKAGSCIFQKPHQVSCLFNFQVDTPRKAVRSALTGLGGKPHPLPLLPVCGTTTFLSLFPPSNRPSVNMCILGAQIWTLALVLPPSMTGLSTCWLGWHVFKQAV